MYGTGISRAGEILDLAVKLDIINKSGAWFSYNGERLGQGRDNVKIYLQEHRTLPTKLTSRSEPMPIGSVLPGRKNGGAEKKSLSPHP